MEKMKINNINRLYIKGYFNYIVLSLFFLLQCFTPNAMYLTYAILFCLIVSSSLSQGLSLVVFTFPFYIINKTPNVLLFLFCLVVFFIKCMIETFSNKNTKPNNGILWLLFILGVYLILPIGEYNTNKLIHISYIVVLYLCLFVFMRQSDIINIKYNTRLFMVSLLISCLFSLTYFISPYMQANKVFAYAEGFARFEALLIHTNVFAMYCEVILALMLYRIVKKDVNYFDYILVGLLAIISIFTFSKMYYIILFAILIVYFVILFIQNKKKATIITSVLIGGILIISIFKFEYIQLMFHRFFDNFSLSNSLEDNLNSITTYRYGLWKEYITAIFSNPLIFIFGKGLGAKPISTLSAHNAYISMFYQLGLIGTTLFISSLIKLIKYNSNKKFDKALIIPMVVFGLMLFIEDTMFYIYK